MMRIMALTFSFIGIICWGYAVVTGVHFEQWIPFANSFFMVAVIILLLQIDDENNGAK